MDEPVRSHPLVQSAKDVAAGAVLVREAGGLVTDLRGGGDWLFGGSVLASNGLLHEALLARVGDP